MFTTLDWPRKPLRPTAGLLATKDLNDEVNSRWLPGQLGTTSHEELEFISGLVLPCGFRCSTQANSGGKRTQRRTEKVSPSITSSNPLLEQIAAEAARRESYSVSCI